MESVAGKIAFVTGAASGIGYGIASALVGAGARVMLCDIDETELTRAASTLGEGVGAVVADVSVRDEIQAAASKTLDRFDKLHILVNNAGVGVGGRYGSWSELAWRWSIDVNLMGVVWGIEAFLPLIEQHGEGGHVVSTASMAGVIPSSSSPYAVTKYGVVALSEGLRSELAGRGIGVSVLCPGLVRTRVAELGRNRPDRFADAPVGLTPAQQARLASIVASGCDPAYVGELVLKGIEQNWAYIFTDLEHEAEVETRFNAIRRDLDHIRDLKLHR